MKVLVIEDDEIKFRMIESFLRSSAITWMRSYQSGLEAVTTSKFDLLILDMTLPVYDVTEDEGGFDHLVFAGELIMQEMDRRGISMPTVVITQYNSFFDAGEEVSFSTLSSRLMTKFSNRLKDVIYLSSTSGDWQERLTKCL